jgi:branched-chain amino acid transport system permease protein
VLFKKLFSGPGIGFSLLLFLVLLALPSFVPRFFVYILGLIYVTSLLAMSLNLLVGHGGLFQFHHAVFYGVGAYTLALILTKTSLPSWVGFLAAPIVAALFGLGIGWFCVRLTQLYFGMLQISLGSLVWAIVYRWYKFTGGDDGIHGIHRPEFFGPVTYYLFCLAILLLCLLVMRMIINSSFGLAIRTTRENTERAKFIGINVQRYQLLNFIIAGAFAGISGGLITELNRFAQTEFLHWSKSAEPIFASLVGGMYSLIGPVIGSTVLMFLKIVLQQVHQSLVEIWALFLGLILLLAVLFAPEGIMGLYQKIAKKS